MAINLKHYFPHGTIGYEMKYSGNPLDGIFGFDVQEHKDNFFMDVLELDSEAQNPDDVLREMGFYDSTDKRSCINKKRR